MSGYLEINDPDFYNDITQNYCDNMAPYEHEDGIDIFFGKLSTEAFGRAHSVVAKSFVIGGMWGSLPAYISPTIVHEMGHCLGLHHTYYGFEPVDITDACDEVVAISCPECADGSNGWGCGDFVHDTPATRSLGLYSIINCQFPDEDDCSQRPEFCDECEPIPNQFNQYNPLH